MSRARQVHVVSASSGPFTAALPPYLADLGLTVHEHRIDTPAALRELMTLLSSDHNPASVAVLPLEGQPPVDGAGPQPRAARLPPLAVAAVEVCAACLGPDNCVTTAQLADPLDEGALSVDVVRVSNDVEGRTALKQTILDAGCTIAGDVLSDDQPSHGFEFPSDWWQGSSGDTHATPSFMEFLVDAAFNRELTQTKLQEEAMDRVKKAEELDLKYHYVGWKMAENWNALTDDRTYAHASHRRAVSAQIGDMAKALPPETSFRYVGLGPGDGKTDVALLPELAKHRVITSCFFVDVSIELLQVATNRVITDLIQTDLFTPRHIRAVLGDFEDSLSKLAPVLTTGDGDRSFFSLSGFTVGNSKERELLKSLAAGMQAGDFLLMDARLHGLGEVKSITDEQKEALLAPYMSTAMQKFAFGPVEDLCDYTVRLGDSDVEIHYEPSIGTAFTSDVSHAINVYIDAAGMYANPDFRQKIGLRAMKLPVRSAGERRKRLRLVTLTFYDFDSLARWIEETRAFTVRWKRDLGGTGMLLLERLDTEGV